MLLRADVCHTFCMKRMCQFFLSKFDCVNGAFKNDEISKNDEVFVKPHPHPQEEFFRSQDHGLATFLRNVAGKNESFLEFLSFLFVWEISCYSCQSSCQQPTSFFETYNFAFYSQVRETTSSWDFPLYLLLSKRTMVLLLPSPKP